MRPPPLPLTDEQALVCEHVKSVLSVDTGILCYKDVLRGSLTFVRTISLTPQAKVYIERISGLGEDTWRNKFAANVLVVQQDTADNENILDCDSVGEGGVMLSIDSDIQTFGFDKFHEEAFDTLVRFKSLSYDTQFAPPRAILDRAYREENQEIRAQIKHICIYTCVYTQSYNIL